MARVYGYAARGHDNDPYADSASRASNEAQSAHNARIENIVDQVDAEAHRAAQGEATALNIDSFVVFESLKEPYERTEIFAALKARGYTVDDNSGFGPVVLKFAKKFGQPSGPAPLRESTSSVHSDKSTYVPGDAMAFFRSQDRELQRYEEKIANLEARPGPLSDREKHQLAELRWESRLLRSLGARWPRQGD